MAKFKEGYIVQILYEGDDPELKKYNRKFGLVHYVDDRANLNSVHYTVLVPDMFSVWIEEKWLKNANSWQRWKCVNDLAGSKGLDLISTSSGKLYCNGTLVADVVNANNRCYGNKVEQVFFDEFITEEDKENKSMFKVGDYVITTRASWVIPAGTKGYVMDIDPVKGIYVGYKNGVDTPQGRIMTGWTDPCRLKVISLEEYDKRMVKKENKNMLGIGDKVKTVRQVWSIPCGKVGTVIDADEYSCTVLFDTPVYDSDYPDAIIRTRKFSHSTLVLVRKYGELEKKDTELNLTPTPAYFAKNYIRPEKVIFSGNRTVVLWSDGDKTIVKASCEAFDREKGLAMAIAKKFMGTNVSKSNYYDIFKKWIPEELIEQHEMESKPKDFPRSTPEEMSDEDPNKPWNSSMRHQISSDEIVDKIMAGADTEDLKKSIEKSKKILDAEKKGVKPSISGYFPSEPSERGPIQNFVEKFYPGYFPAEFIAFCKKYNLGFVVDNKVINPYEVKWQNVAGFLRRGVIAMKKKINPSDGHEYMAVDMENMLFQRLPRNTKDNKEEVKND